MGWVVGIVILASCKCHFIRVLAGTPLEASSGTLNVFLYLKYVYFAFDVYVGVELSF